MPKLIVEFEPDVIEQMQEYADACKLTLPEFVEMVIYREVLGPDIEEPI